MDTTPRIIKIGDALSQLVNVALLPTHRSTTANESISGRAHRMGWRRVGAPSIVWVLADNIPATVTVGELTEALVLSGQEQGRVWIIE